MIKGSDSKPVKRIVAGFTGDEYVVEIRERTIVIREKGRRAETAMTVTAAGLYQRLVQAHVDGRRGTRGKG